MVEKRNTDMSHFMFIFSAAPIIGDALMAWTAFYVRPLDPAKSNSPIATKFGIYNPFIVEMCT